MLAAVLAPDGAIGILLLNSQKIMANPIGFLSSNFSDQQRLTASLISDAFSEAAIAISLELGSFLRRYLIMSLLSLRVFLQIKGEK